MPKKRQQVYDESWLNNFALSFGAYSIRERSMNMLELEFASFVERNKGLREMQIKGWAASVKENNKGRYLVEVLIIEHKEALPSDMVVTEKQQRSYVTAYPEGRTSGNRSLGYASYNSKSRG